MNTGMPRLYGSAVADDDHACPVYQLRFFAHPGRMVSE
jgi:hypothetical protein